MASVFGADMDLEEKFQIQELDIRGIIENALGVNPNDIKDIQPFRIVYGLVDKARQDQLER